MPYEIRPFSDSYFTGKNSVFGSQIPSDVAREKIGSLFDSVLKIQQIIFGLSNYYRRLPEGKFSTILYPGIVPSDPLRDAVKVSLELESPHLFVAGHHLGYPVGFKDSTEEGRVRQYLLLENISSILDTEYSSQAKPSLIKPKIYTQVHAEHTGQQAEWVAKQVRDSEAEAVVIMAASGHIPRALLTQLMAFAKIGVKIPIIPVPHAINPCTKTVPNMSQVSAEDEGNAFTQAEFSLSEWFKILTYTEHVASLAMLEEYCEWLAEHEFFKQM